MAKIRVFELARDLNMTNKVLLERMRDLDISVVSHLSSLEDEDVAKIKENVVGGKHKKAEVIPVRPTVIRRRRDAVAKEAVPDEKPPCRSPPGRTRSRDRGCSGTGSEGIRKAGYRRDGLKAGKAGAIGKSSNP